MEIGTGRVEASNVCYTTRLVEQTIHERSHAGLTPIAAYDFVSFHGLVDGPGLHGHSSKVARLETAPFFLHARRFPRLGGRKMPIIDLPPSNGCVATSWAITFECFVLCDRLKLQRFLRIPPHAFW